MKLLFDHNLSPRLVHLLADIYLQSSHVAELGLDRAADDEVWEVARAAGFTIVTKDSDFNDLVVLRGFPPKVIWLRLGNCTTSHAEQTLRTSYQVISEFVSDIDTGILELT